MPHTPAPSKPTTIAATLAASLQRQIADGAFRPGDKLPSLRELAELHGYAKNTVVAAFELLVSRGIVEPRRGSGYYVLAAAESAPKEEEAGSLGRAMDVVWLMREQLKWEADQLSVGDGFPPVEEDRRPLNDCDVGIDGRSPGDRWCDLITPAS